MAKSKVQPVNPGVSDTFWQQVAPLLPQPQRNATQDFVRKPGAGRKPKPSRLVLDAILLVLRSGCPWKALPSTPYGSASAVHKHYLEWLDAGVFDAIWASGLATSDDMAGIAWRWQYASAGTSVTTPANPAVGPAQPGQKVWRPAIHHRARNNPVEAPPEPGNRQARAKFN